MSFFKKMKGDHPDAIGNEDTQYRNDDSQYESFDPPPGPPPAHGMQSKVPAAYEPPPGPPPGHDVFAPPAGPPPGHEDFAPPDGPPPSHVSHDSEPPPYHDWTVIPDTALLPPPPSIGRELGSTSNADSAEADRAHEWCRVNPLMPPHQPSNAQHSAIQAGDIRLMKPKEYKGDLLQPSKGTWRGSTRSGAADSCLISSAPLFFAAADSPVKLGQKRTIYFEIEITSLGRGQRNEECSIAIGYCAMPYPTWRMPGWERGSLAVHSDDGCRYVNDTWGGKDFTQPFKTGETIGLGMSFSVPETPAESHAELKQPTKLNTEIFFTRNGEKDGNWNLHEELDADTDRGIDGLDGSFDLYAAIGIFGGAEFKVKFQRQSWLFLPR